MTERIWYELWDVETNNAVASFATQGEAVAFVRQIVAKQSAEYLEQLVLLEVNRFGHTKDLARGRDELDRFQARGGTIGAQ
ncbi:MAG: hypothetical protein KGK07_06485 [Chloroflexota bacterium]|nr:hypothetical protein [Chloroflexota bacterium]MDE3095631.1 hypothetical protein [Chloroflexota bacterium]